MSENKDFFAPSNFIVTFDKLPGIAFNAISVNLPGVRVNPGDNFYNPMKRIAAPGDHPDFDPFSISFVVDEELENYLSVYNWLSQIAFPKTFEQFEMAKEDDNGPNPGENSNVLSDCTLIIMNNKKIPILSVNFHYIFPTGLTALDLDVRDDAQQVIAVAEFEYQDMTFARPGVAKGNELKKYDFVPKKPQV